MGLLPLGSYADVGGVLLVLAFLAFFTVTTFMNLKGVSRRGKVIVGAVVLSFDAVCLAIVIARYGHGVWFPSD
jgi:hypothetical protein